MDLGMKTHSFEEVDDDVFYEELRRQVLQLTAEEDDEDDAEVINVYDRKVIMNAVERGPNSIAKPVSYNGWPGINKEAAAAPATPPAWMWRSGNGTGVFIPQGVHSRRKNRSRKKHDRGRAYRKVE